MAAIAPQFALVPEPAAPVVQPSPTLPVMNPNQAQGTVAPEDTVTLTNQAAQGQAAGQGTNAGSNQLAAFFLADAGAFAVSTNAQNQPVSPPILPSQAPVNVNNLNPALNSNAAQAAQSAVQLPDTTVGAGTKTAGSAQTPQQELAELDQTLQEIGVNPQGISLFSRMAMLLYANDPAALSVLVQTLQRSDQQTEAQPTNANPATSSSSAAAATNGPQAQNGTGAPQQASPTQTSAPTVPAPVLGTAAAPAAGNASVANSPFTQFQVTSQAIDREIVSRGNSDAQDGTPPAVDVSI